MDISDLERDLAGGSIRPVYLFHGQENLLKDRMIEKLVALVPEGLRDFNLQFLLAEEATTREVHGQAMTLPLMGRPRVVVVRGVDNYSAEDLSILETYLDDPNESACLVLTADKPDFRLKFYKKLREMDYLVAFDLPKGRGLASWVREAFERRGKQVADDAVRTLIERIGADISELDQEVEKICLFALKSKRIGAEEVRIAARMGHTANVFELGDAVGLQNPERALSALKDLLATDHYMPILHMLIRHFRLLLKARLLAGRSIRESEAAGALGVPPFVVRKYLDQARKLDMPGIKMGLASLLKANLTLISDPAPPNLVMERLVLELSTLRRNSGP